MVNPFTMKSWSPYVVGVGIGALSWFAFGTAIDTLRLLFSSSTRQLSVQGLWSDAEHHNVYYTVRYLKVNPRRSVGSSCCSSEYFSEQR
jgi:hypothetical protein